MLPSRRFPLAASALAAGFLMLLPPVAAPADAGSAATPPLALSGQRGLEIPRDGGGDRGGDRDGGGRGADRGGFDRGGGGGRDLDRGGGRGFDRGGRPVIDRPDRPRPGLDRPDRPIRPPLVERPPRPDRPDYRPPRPDRPDIRPPRPDRPDYRPPRPPRPPGVRPPRPYPPGYWRPWRPGLRWIIIPVPTYEVITEVNWCHYHAYRVPGMAFHRDVRCHQHADWDHPSIRYVGVTP